MGNKSDWLPHYYQTLYMFLTNEDSKNQQEIFTEIFSKLKQWEKRDKFIRNALNSEGVNENFKKIFLKYLRDAINEKLMEK